MVLLRGVARGDEDALAALYDRHAGWLTIRMTRRCAAADMVDHAVQDTFLALWRQAGAYRGTGDVAAPFARAPRPFGCAHPLVALE